MILSDRIKTHPDFLESQDNGKIIFVDDIKDFIKELKSEIKRGELANGEGCGVFVDDVFKDIDKLAGKEFAFGGKTTK